MVGLSDSTGSGSESGTSDLPKPNCTITPRHDSQLDELADARYASRSEALRAAIESLTKSVHEGGETTAEQLITEINSVASQVGEMADQLDELQETLQTRGASGRPAPSDGEANSDQVASAVSTDESQTSAGLENEVYTLLTERDAMSVPEIADNVPGNEIQVHESVSQLVERGFVTRSGDEGRPRYQVEEIEQ